MSPFVSKKTQNHQRKNMKNPSFATATNSLESLIHTLMAMYIHDYVMEYEVLRI